MPRGCSRLFAVLCATILLGSCDKEPFSPDGSDPSLSASPGDPVNLTATAVSATQLNIAWEDRSTRETGFELHRSTGSNGTFDLWLTTGPDVTTFSDAGLTAATEYCYKVRSFRTTGRKVTYSGFSNTACATTQNVPPPPPGPTAPSDVNARPAESHTASVYLTWKDNSTDEDGFRVERGPSEQGPWERAALFSANNSAFYDYTRPVEQRLCYRVIVFKGQSESASNVDCTYLPAAPTALVVTATSGQAVDLAWTDNSAVEDGFEIERSENEWGPFASAGTTAADVTTFHDATVSPDKTYWYRVRVTREGSRTGSTNIVKTITVTSPPVAPSQLNATPVGSGVISVVWVDNSANETGFRLERSENGGATWATVISTPYQGFWDDGRTSDQQLCYRVIAHNSLGDSPPSNIDCTAPPAAPTNLTAVAVAGLAINLTWDDNSSVEDGYEIRLRYEDCGYYGCYEWYSPVAAVGPNVTSYRHEGLVPQLYTYVVVALKDGGESDVSNIASAWSELPPEAPSSLTALAVSRTQIDLAWADNSSDEAGFAVRRCTGTEATCNDDGFITGFWVVNATTFSDTTVQPNTTYTYRVHSCNSVCSVPSNKASAITPP